MAWLSLPAIGCGIMGLAAPEEIAAWISTTLIVWGLVALPVGIALRRSVLPHPLRFLVSALLWMPVLVSTFLILERSVHG